MLDQRLAVGGSERGLPHDFIRGASTSSYQIEGASGADGRGASVWDEYCKISGCIANNDTGAVACDHYHRYAEDIALMRQRGIQAYRFSVAWPRVLPQGGGPPNEAGLGFYDRLIDGLLAAGIEPWIDRERIAYLRSYGGALREAVAAGADVRGYFVWSLLDNFEWGAGYSNRFGLVYVDYATQRRIPKASAHWYARMIRADALEAAQ